MSDKNGWICLHRSLIKHWIYQEPEALKFWVTLLMEANWETKTTLFNKKLITVERGQIVFGRKVYSKRLGISEMKLRRYLEMLTEEGMINQQTTSRYTVITVLNYDQYQDKNQQTTSKQPAYNQHITTSKQVNNKTIKQKDSTSMNKFTERDVAGAKSMYEKILLVAPKIKEPDFDNWADQLRLMREQDNLSHKEIWAVFIFANNDQFWSSNILSPKTLRTKFSSLHAKMNGANNAKQNGYKSTTDKLRESAKNAGIEIDSAGEVIDGRFEHIS
tara:strand:- start:552 stop:1373 length:822 start_codon:yes stop_codon:yes gene_type:complete